MKRLGTIAAIAVIGLVGVWMLGKQPTIKDLAVKSGNMTVSPTQKPIHPTEQGQQIEVGGKKYVYSFWQASQPEQLRLIPNYEEQKNSASISTEFGCEFGVNGGLYDTNNAPLGLVVAENKETAKYRPSQVYNGVVGVTAQSQFYIGNDWSGDFVSAVQTGPVLINNGQVQKLELTRDKQARRMAAALTTARKLHMVAIYTPELVFDGPLLADLPEVMDQIGRANGGYTSAINLDGGSASAIKTSETELGEWQPVGSWWCYGSDDN